MTALELHVDLLPGVVHLVADADQPIVQHDDKEADEDEHAKRNKQNHGILLFPPGRAAERAML